MDKATQSMYALIGVIKEGNPVPFENAINVLANYYPVEECEWRLNIYTQALYELGVIEADVWSYMEEYIYDALEETLSRMMPHIREYADQLIEAREGACKLLVRKAELEAIVAMGDPTKTEPDTESMEFWNMMSVEIMDYMMAVEELERL